MILDANTLIQLTGKRRHSAQRLALDAMGVPYRVRPDGCVIVVAADLEHRPSHPPPITPNWAALESRRQSGLS